MAGGQPLWLGTPPGVGRTIVDWFRHSLAGEYPGGPSIPSALIGWLNTNQVGCWLITHLVVVSFVSPVVVGTCRNIHALGVE